MTASDVFMSYISKDVADTVRLDAEDAAQEIADVAEAARVKAQADEQAATDAAEAAADAFRELDPPTDIGGDLADVPPQRARLIRYHAWLARLTEERDELEAGRVAFLETMNVAVLTQAKIDDLVAKDTTGLISAMARGGQGFSRHQIRSEEKRRLQEQLADDQHAAEVSRAGLVHTESEIDAKTRQIEILTERQNEFLADAIEEHVVQTAGPQLLAAVAQVRDAEMELLGATAHIQQLRGISYAQQPRRATLPTPRLHIAGVRGAAGPGMVISGTADEPIPLDHAIEWPVHEQIQTQRRIAELAKQLAADPRAQLGTS